MKWLLEGHNESNSGVRIGDRIYSLFGSTARVEGKPGVFATVYFVDRTEFETIRQAYEENKPAVAVLLIDNYDEISKNAPANEMSRLLGSIEAKIGQWLPVSDFLTVKYDRDRYLLAFERKHLKRFDQRTLLDPRCRKGTFLRADPADAQYRRRHRRRKFCGVPALRAAGH